MFSVSLNRTASAAAIAALAAGLAASVPARAESIATPAVVQVGAQMSARAGERFAVQVLPADSVVPANPNGTGVANGRTGGQPMPDEPLPAQPQPQPTPSQ